MFEEKLEKDTSDGSDHSEMTIKFALVVEEKTFKNTWSALLKKIELLNQIVADIAEVSSSWPLNSFLLNVR